MGKKIAIAVVVIASMLAAVFAAYLASKPAAAQSAAAQCVINVPQDWGDYVGSGPYGLEFKDSSGTLRFVNKMPCGLEGAPNVALEIRRK
ncbi:MAG: hypothetical protein ACRD5G_17250 [Candidatus Acidiferrales bacterium]